jgi:alpha/beta superfamily hydrolase
MSDSSELDQPLPAPGQSRAGLVRGTAGRIEILFAAPAQTLRGGVLICHPHPLYGGALSNKVTYSLAATALKAGFAALRFNFRGVGKSEGLHDNGAGETEDAVLLAEWLRQRLPAGAPLVLAGFSFGSYIALKAASRVQPAALMSVAPPLGKYLGYQAPPHPHCPWRVLHSRDDEVVSYQTTLAELQQYQPMPELITVDGCGHFFHGRLNEVQDAFGGLLDALFGPPA